jgi:hypothetical protein
MEANQNWPKMPLNLKHNHSNYPTAENLKFINLGL